MGEVFAGRYELADPIGRGGAGAVWRAWDRRRGRYVAAKVLQQSDAHSLLRFVREQALRIDHPHVLAPASWAADDDKVLFTMDLVSGGSLAHLVGDHGPLPPRFVCTLLDQLLSGLAAVHAEDVVHRDIKPANILLEATGRDRRPHLRLSDFGIAMRKGEPRLTESDFVVGTPGYFAPEQLAGAEPDFPADLFAVGLVGLYLLTGYRTDSLEIVARYEYEQGVPPAPERVPEPLWQVLGQLLRPDPDQRFRTATGARKALAAAAEMLPEEDAGAGSGSGSGPEAGTASGPGAGSGTSTTSSGAVEVFDHIGPLPEGFGPDGPEQRPSARPTAGNGDVRGGAGAAGRAGGAALADAPTATAQAAGPTPQPSSTGDFPLAPPQGQFGAPAPVGARPAGMPGPVGAPASAGAAVPVGSPGRPGPPAKVAVPMLVVALLCLTVGVWALAAA